MSERVCMAQLLHTVWSWCCQGHVREKSSFPLFLPLILGGYIELKPHSRQFYLWLPSSPEGFLSNSLQRIQFCFSPPCRGSAPHCCFVAVCYLCPNNLKPYRDRTWVMASVMATLMQIKIPTHLQNRGPHPLYQLETIQGSVSSWSLTFPSFWSCFLVMSSSPPPEM